MLSFSPLSTARFAPKAAPSFGMAVQIVNGDDGQILHTTDSDTATFTLGTSDARQELLNRARAHPNKWVGDDGQPLSDDAATGIEPEHITEHPLPDSSQAN